MIAAETQNWSWHDIRKDEVASKIIEAAVQEAIDEIKDLENENDEDELALALQRIAHRQKNFAKALIEAACREIASTTMARVRAEALRKQQRPVLAPTRAQMAEAQKKASERTKRVIATNYEERLDSILPNGKRFRDATYADVQTACGFHSARLGYYRAVLPHLKGGKVVGQVFKEADLAKIEDDTKVPA